MFYATYGEEDESTAGADYVSSVLKKASERGKRRRQEETFIKRQAAQEEVTESEQKKASGEEEAVRGVRADSRAASKAGQPTVHPA